MAAKSAEVDKPSAGKASAVKLQTLVVVASLVPAVAPTGAWACGHCGCPSVRHHVARHHVVAAPAHVESYYSSSYDVAYAPPPVAYPVYYAPPVYAAPVWSFGYRYGPYGWGGGYHPYWGGYGGYYRGFHGGYGGWGHWRH